MAQDPWAPLDRRGERALHPARRRGVQQRGGLVEDRRVRVRQQHSGEDELRDIGRGHQGRARPDPTVRAVRRERTRFREQDGEEAGIERLPQPRVRRVRRSGLAADGPRR
ncbi:hypothetical protein [Streptomyces sp. NPDC054865]